MRRRVSVDDAGVTVIDDAGSDRVAWVDLVAVTIRTTDAGPMHDDFLWQLHRVDGNILTVGSETDGMELLLERLQRLPGFDNEAVIAARPPPPSPTSTAGPGGP